MKVYKIRLKKGDTVMVRTGKYKGQTGTVQAIHAKENKVTVEGINVVKKALKPDQHKQHPRGGIVEITKPIWVSKVGIVDPSNKKPSRIGYKLTKEGKKTRVYKKSGKEVIKAKPKGKETK